MRSMKKSNLPEKDCIVCGRPFKWRKKWEKCWDEEINTPEILDRSLWEQQRELGKTCPSLFDLRNLFQVNVEEGRHLWAMVYLLHAYFGRDGREEAED